MKYFICSTGDQSEREFIPEIIAKGIGVELQGYGFRGIQSIKHWNRVYEQHRQFRVAFDGDLAVHGPFIAVNYCHDDHLMRDAVRIRLDMIFDVARKLRAETLILHSGLQSDVKKYDIYEDWIEATAKFWREEVKRYAGIGVKVVLENIVDDTPEFLQRVHDLVDHSNLKICLDTGHVNVWSERTMDEWITGLGDRIGHVHVHNNNGLSDQHESLENGTLNLKKDLARIKRELPDADISLEIRGTAGDLIKIYKTVKAIGE